MSFYKFEKLTNNKEVWKSVRLTCQANAKEFCVVLTKQNMWKRDPSREISRKNNIASYLIPSVHLSFDSLKRSWEVGVEACWSWSKPPVWRLENINPAVAVPRSGCALLYGSEKQRFPCWCVLIRLELLGPAIACLVVDLERGDYLPQLLSSLLPRLMPLLLKGQQTPALSATYHN